MDNAINGIYLDYLPKVFDMETGTSIHCDSPSELEGKFPIYPSQETDKEMLDIFKQFGISAFIFSKDYNKLPDQNRYNGITENLTNCLENSLIDKQSTIAFINAIISFKCCQQEQMLLYLCVLKCCTNYILYTYEENVMYLPNLSKDFCILSQYNRLLEESRQNHHEISTHLPEYFASVRKICDITQLQLLLNELEQSPFSVEACFKTANTIFYQFLDVNDILYSERIQKIRFNISKCYQQFESIIFQNHAIFEAAKNDRLMNQLQEAFTTFKM